MIKKVMLFFYVLGVLFWGGMMLSALFKYFVFNEYLSLFEVQKIKIAEFELKSDPLQPDDLSLHYSYTVDGEVYDNKLDVVREYYDDNFRLTTDGLLEVNYIKVYPQINYLTSLPLEKRRAKIGIIIAIFFLSFISLIYFFAKKKWSV